MTSKIVVNNIEPDAGISTVTVVGNVESTKFVGAVEGSVTGNVTGNLTGTASTSTNAATAYAIDSAASLNTSGIVTATSFAPTTGQLSHRNIIVNGAMNVAQRGSSSTSDGFHTVDRFRKDEGGTDESTTQSQVDVSAGTTPYTFGFRKAFRLTNGNQTSGAGASDYSNIQYLIEGQDITNSGWNYKSSSSFITLSFWVKSSVAQTFYAYARTKDGTNYHYPFSFALSADTWTKVTKTIPGNSNLQIDNDNGEGMQLTFMQFYGTAFTDSGVTLNAWGATGSGNVYSPDNTSTWWTTNDATFEITGVQLEVGSVATPFEHRSHGEELSRCSRYLQIFHVPTNDSRRASNITATVHGTGQGVYLNIAFIHPMRAAPSLTVHGSFGGNVFTGSWSGATLSNYSSEYYTDPQCTLGFHGITSASVTGSHTTGLTGQIYTGSSGNDAALIYSAEL